MDDSSGSIREAALKAARARHKGRQQLSIRGVEEDTVPSTGGKVYRFHIGSEPAPNQGADGVVLDDAGREVEIEQLNRREGKRHFEPEKPEVRFGRVAPAVPSALATIEPAENVLTLNPGDSHAEIVTVKVPKSAAAPKIDVYFLADTTGSMGSILSAVKAGAGNILASLAVLGDDFHFGAGNYKDFPHDSYAFQHQQSMTLLSAAVTAAIDAWSASGGGDGPEGQFYALHRIAAPAGGAIGWRAGAKRIVVWFGDYPAHDPICPAISGESAAITEASVTAKLVAEGIAILALSVLSPGLDGDPAAGAIDYTAKCGPPGGSAGQATRIANATGGQFASGIDAGNIVDTIIDLVTVAVGTINNLKLVPTGATAPFVASITPAAGYGPLAGEREHELKFEVVFRGRPCRETEQVFTGAIDAVADGNVVASKRVRIIVPPCRAARFTYSVKFVCGQQPECPCECTSVRPGVYATEINIHNYQNTEVKIEKWVTPVVFMGAPAGREPGVAKPRAADRIVLPPHTATMDDCCRIAELLLGGASQGGALNVGFLEISASAEIAVTVVYTSSGLHSGGVSIDVQEVKGRKH